MNDLQKAYEALCQTKIPSFCGQDRLDDWLEELIELDAQLAGLACSAISGEKILKKDIPRMSLLKDRLSQIQSLYPKYEKTVDQFSNYLQLLIQIEHLMKSLSKN